MMEFREYLEKFGFSEVRFARLIDVSPETVTRWCESHRDHIPVVVLLYLDEIELRMRLLSEVEDFTDMLKLYGIRGMS